MAIVRLDMIGVVLPVNEVGAGKFSNTAGSARDNHNPDNNEQDNKDPGSNDMGRSETRRKEVGKRDAGDIEGFETLVRKMRYVSAGAVSLTPI